MNESQYIGLRFMLAFLRLILQINFPLVIKCHFHLFNQFSKSENSILLTKETVLERTAKERRVDCTD